MGRRRRTLLIVLLAAVGLAAAGLWLARDLPRQRVEAALAEALGAEVRVGRLEIRGTREAVLHRVKVTRMTAEPRLVSLRVERLEVTGGLGEVLDNRYEHLVFSGVEVALAPAPRPLPTAESRDAGEIFVGLLEVEDARVRAEAGGEAAELGVRARFQGIGEAPEGEVEVAAERLELGPLFALLRAPDGGEGSPLRGRVEGLSGTFRLTEEGGRLEATAQARRAEMAAGGRGAELDGVELNAGLDLGGPGDGDGGSRLEAALRARRAEAVAGESLLPLEGPSLSATAVSQPGGDLRFELTPELSGLREARIEGTWGGDPAALAELEARLSGLDLEAWLPALGLLPAGWELQGTADVELTGSPQGGLTYRASATLPRLHLPGAGGGLTARGAEIEVNGETRFEPGDELAGRGPLRLELRLRELAGALPGGGSTAGPVPPQLSPASLVVDGDLAFGRETALEGRLELRPGALGHLTARGALSAAPEGPPTGDLDWHWRDLSLAALTDLAAGAGYLPFGDPRVSGTLEAQGTLRGTLEAPAVTASLAFADLALATGVAAASSPQGRGTDPEQPQSQAWTFAFPKAGLEASWKGPGRPVEVALPELTGILAAPGLPAAEVSLRAEGSLSPGDGSFRLRDGVLSSPGLGTLAAAGTWTPEEGGRASLRLADAEPGRWLAFLAPVLGDPLAGYSLSGSIGTAVEARLGAAGDWTAEGTATLAGGFSSDDGSRVAEGIGAQLEIEARRPAGAAVEARARGSLGGFQVLWGTLFADYSGVQADLDLEASLTPAEDGAAAWQGRLAASLPAGPSLEATLAGGVTETVTYGAALRVDDLGATLDRYLRGPAAGSVAAIDELRTAGALQVRLDGVVSPERTTARGQVEIRELAAATGDGGLEVHGLDLDLPVDLILERPADGGEPTLSGGEGLGSLRFESLTAAGIRFPATATALAVRADTLELEQAVTVPFLGGSLTFRELALADLARETRHLASALELDGVSLARATESLGLLPLEGELRGTFPRVRVGDGSFRMEGDGTFQVFGGSLTVRDISGRDILSSYPRVSFSAEFDGFDLAQITHTFDFGEMTGIVRGSLSDCQLFGGVPVRLRGRIETVERKGVPRTISVKAINNIAIVGTGSRVTVLDRGIHRLFDHYTYSALGVEMQLAQDRFLLRGLESRGDRELFLKGRLPFRIDVVNVQPGKTVSFSTMLERLDSLDFAAATTEQPSP